MKLRRLILLVLSLFLLFGLAACDGESGDPIDDGENIATPDDNEKSSDSESSDQVENGSEDSNLDEENTSDIGKRSNPVPIGEWVEFQDSYYESIESMDAIDGKFRLRLTDIERGDAALDQLMEENQFNEPAPEGNEWVIAEFEIEMIDGDEDVPYTVVPFINVMASTGNEITQDEYGTLDGNEFGYVDLFPGGSHSGRVSKYVPIDDESLLVYEIGFDTGIYFSFTE